MKTNPHSSQRVTAFTQHRTPSTHAVTIKSAPHQRSARLLTELGQNRSVRRIGFLIGAILVLAGMFWAGRESSHGFGALWEHWWCPTPIVAIVVGLATALLLVRRPAQTG